MKRTRLGLSLAEGETGPCSGADEIGRRTGAWVSRRHLLVGAGGTAAGVLGLVACNSRSKSATPPTTGSTVEAKTTTTAAAPSTDAAVAALAGSLEVLAVDAYRVGLALATGNKLGVMPPALVTFATTVLGHHEAALSTWNATLTSAGKPGVSQPPAALQATVDRMFTRTTSATALARLALLVEQTASDTYFSVIPMLKSTDLITVAAQLQSVDQEHAAILRYLLGTYPVPDAFQNANMALSVTNA